MNKSIAYALALAAVSSVALADTASVNFATGSSVGLPLVTGSGAGPFDTAGIHSASYVAQLFYSTDGTSFSAVGTAQPFFNVTSSSVRAGTWKAASFDFPAAVSAGATVSLKVAVWDSSVFATWDAAANEIANLSADPAHLGNGTWFQAGVTSAFSYKTPAPGDLNPADFNMGNFQGLALTGYQVPEPSVVALGALGLGALLWRRRK